VTVSSRACGDRYRSERRGWTACDGNCRRKPRLRGEAHEIRFADDAVLCFQYREDAEKVMDVLPKRFAKYGLTLHPEKTRLLEFGRCAMGKAKRRPYTYPRPESEGYVHSTCEDDE
jgi:hypothetical protein